MSCTVILYKCKLGHAWELIAMWTDRLDGRLHVKTFFIFPAATATPAHVTEPEIKPLFKTTHIAFRV